MKNKTIKIFNYLTLFFLMFSVISQSVPVLAADTGDSSTEHEWFRGDQSRQGAVYLDVRADPASYRFIANSNFDVIGQQLFDEDTKKSPEFTNTGVLFGRASRGWSDAIMGGVNTTSPLSGSTVAGALGGSDSIYGSTDMSSIASWFSPSNAPSNSKSRFENVAEKQLTQQGQNTVNLVMTFPGWAAQNRLSNVTGGWGQSRKNLSSDYGRIDANRASAAATAVANELVSSYNEALEYFYDRVVTKEGNKPALDNDGFANMALLVAMGYLPKKDKQIIYDPSSKSFIFSNNDMIQGVLVPSDSLDSSNTNVSGAVDFTTAGLPIVDLYIKHEAGQSNSNVGTTERFTYAVTKGYTRKTNYPDENYDQMVLSWLDIATSAFGRAYVTKLAVDFQSDTTIVGDQVDSVVNNFIGGLVNFFQLATLDQLLFGERGYLFRNNTLSILMVLIIPFIIVALTLLGLALTRVFLLRQKGYLQTGEVQLIQNSVGNIINAVGLAALLPLFTIVLVLVDQMIVTFAIELNDTFLGVISGAGQGVGKNMSWNWIGNQLASNTFIPLIVLFLTLKYNWRYISRTLSFGLYFLTAPIFFVLDAFDGNGRLFQIGPRSAKSLSSLVGIVLMRGMDALGFVIAVNLVTVMFGSSFLIQIFSFLAVEVITDHLMRSFGLSTGINDALSNTLGNSMRAGFNTAMGLAGGVIGGGLAAASASTESGRTQEEAAYSKQQQDLAQQEAQSVARNEYLNTGGMAGSLGISDGDYGTQVLDDDNPMTDTPISTTSTDTVGNIESNNLRSLRDTDSSSQVSAPIVTPLPMAVGGVSTESGVFLETANEEGPDTKEPTRNIFGFRKAPDPYVNDDGVRTLYDKDGNRVDTDRSNASIWRNIKDGFTNKGAYGAATTDIDDYKGNFNKITGTENQYTHDEDGTISLKDEYKNSFRRRQMGRTIGGFTKGMVSSLPAALVTSTALGATQFTKTHLDNAVVYGAINKQLEHLRTGKSMGVGGVMGGTAAGIASRFLGGDKRVWQNSQVKVPTAKSQQTGTHHSNLPTPTRNGVPQMPSTKTSLYGNNPDSMKTLTTIDVQGGGRETQALGSSMKNIHDGLNKPTNSTGNVVYSRDELVDRVINPITNKPDKDVMNTLAYMDEHSYSSLRYHPESGSLGGITTFNEQENHTLGDHVKSTPVTDNMSVTDANLYDKLANNNGRYASQDGSLHKLVNVTDDEGNVVGQEIKSYSKGVERPENTTAAVTGSMVNETRQEFISQLNKDKTLSDDARNDRIKQSYGSSRTEELNSIVSKQSELSSPNRQYNPMDSVLGAEILTKAVENNNAKNSSSNSSTTTSSSDNTVKVNSQPTTSSSENPVKVNTKPTTSSSDNTVKVNTKPTTSSSDNNVKVNSQPTTSSSENTVKVDNKPKTSSSDNTVKVNSQPTTSSSENPVKVDTKPTTSSSDNTVKVNSQPNTSNSGDTVKVNNQSTSSVFNNKVDKPIVDNNTKQVTKSEVDVERSSNNVLENREEVLGKETKQTTVVNTTPTSNVKNSNQSNNKVEQPKVDQPKVEQTRVEETRVEQPKVETTKVETSKQNSTTKNSEQKTVDTEVKETTKPKKKKKTLEERARIQEERAKNIQLPKDKDGNIDTDYINELLNKSKPKI